MVKNKRLFMGMLVLVIAFVVVPVAFAQDYYYGIADGNFFGDGIETVGYSGSLEHVNQPSAVSMKDKGPIPPGDYIMTAVTTSKGPNTIVLQPTNGTNTFGRSDFRIHGDNSQRNNTGSSGCIVLDSSARAILARLINSGKRPVLHVSRSQQAW